VSRTYDIPLTHNENVSLDIPGNITYFIASYLCICASYVLTNITSIWYPSRICSWLCVASDIHNSIPGRPETKLGSSANDPALWSEITNLILLAETSAAYILSGAVVYKMEGLPEYREDSSNTLHPGTDGRLLELRLLNHSIFGQGKRSTLK
jgi:hypothetical protein